MAVCLVLSGYKQTSKTSAMFSAQLKPIDKMSANKMLLLAAGLVLVCLLIAMAMVAGGQVQKAELRQLSQANFQSAFANCLQSRQGSALRDCARLASSSTDVQDTVSQDASDGISAPGVSLVTLSNRY